VAFSPPTFIRSTVDLMVRAGYDPDAIAGIMGGNWMRVAAAVWK
jgi:microsomal dipeptidase-like Zn-dependent dipeptidase